MGDDSRPREAQERVQTRLHFLSSGILLWKIAKTPLSIEKILEMLFNETRRVRSSDGGRRARQLTIGDALLRVREKGVLGIATSG